MRHAGLPDARSGSLSQHGPLRRAEGAAADGSPAYEIYFTTPESDSIIWPYRRRRRSTGGSPPSPGPVSPSAIDSPEDLPSRFWATSPVVSEQIQPNTAPSLGQARLLPAPFPAAGFAWTRGAFRQIYRLFEMRGLSYGNLSARESVPELGGTTYWMTARGMDKGRVTKVGRDVLLVRGFDDQAGQALVSVPRITTRKPASRWTPSSTSSSTDDFPRSAPSSMSTPGWTACLVLAEFSLRDDRARPRRRRPARPNGECRSGGRRPQESRRDDHRTEPDGYLYPNPRADCSGPRCG